MLKRRMIETVGSKLKTVKTERKRRFNNSMKQKKTQFANFKIKKYMALQLCEFNEQFIDKIYWHFFDKINSQKTGSIGKVLLAWQPFSTKIRIRWPFLVNLTITLFKG